MKKIVKTLDIGEVVKLVGLPPSTLRYYEEKGLIRSLGRTGLRRYFDERVVEKLEFIAMGQLAGFTLEEIASMFASDGRLQVNRKFLLEKSTRIERDIKQLEAVQNTIQHVAKCSAPDHLACPKFQRLLKLAVKKQIRSRKKRT